jgi:hypothetical protein
MNGRWLIAGGLGAMAGMAQAADVQLFGIHTPSLGKWAVYARIVNNDGTAGISSIGINVLTNTSAGVGTATVLSSGVNLPYGDSTYSDPVRWPNGVGYGFWVPGLRQNGTIDSTGAHDISAAQFTTYDRPTTTIPYQNLLLTGVGLTSGSALKNDTSGGVYKTSAGYWQSPVQVASGTYTPASLTGAGAALGLKLQYSDSLGSVNLLRFDSNTQDYTVEGAKQASVIDSRNVTLGQSNAGDTTVLARGGDADLNGAVNFDDLLVLAKNYNRNGATWLQGDFDYNGVVNFDDLLVLAKNYNVPAPSDPAFSPEFNAAMASAFASVPEPTSLLGLAAMGAPLIVRGRRVRKK